VSLLGCSAVESSSSWLAFQRSSFMEGHKGKQAMWSVQWLMKGGTFHWKSSKEGLDRGDPQECNCLLENVIMKNSLQKDSYFLFAYLAYSSTLKMDAVQTNSMVWVRERTILSDRRLSAKWFPTFADRGCHVVSVTDPYGRILGFLDRSHYFSIK
jgi:hypothetical protein